MDAQPIPIETLLAHRAWVRSVARAVVDDASAADDVEQEAWLAALSSPPRNASAVRGWFRVVLRNRARRVGRTETRRERRETVAARPEATSSAAELAELADTHRRVVQAVVDLPEPYRETILLRYFEGLAVDDVAARTSVPLDTARSRISRGLAKLRERLAREFGTDERPWALALAPLIAAPKGSSGPAAAGGGAVMASTKTMAAVAGALLLVAGIGAVVVPKWTSGDEKPVTAAPVETPAPPAPKPDEPKHVAPPPAVKRPRAVEDPTPPPAEPAKPTAPAETVMQRLAKAPIAGRWTNVPVPNVFAEVAAKTGVEIVVSAEAHALWAQQWAGTNVDIELDGAAASQVLDLLTSMKSLAWVIEEPRIVIVPKGVTRDASKPVVALPPWTPPTPLTVIGRVIDAAGAAVVGAEVVQIQAGGTKVVATTDVAGRYEVKLTKPFGSLEAHAAGHLPSPAVSVDGRPGEQVTLDLATRGAAGSLTVRVTSDGGPLAGVVVAVGPQQDAGATLADNRPAVLRARREITDAQGVASFPGVVGDDVVVTASLRHYEGVERKVAVEAGKASEVDVRLVKAPPLAERLASKRATFSFQNAHPGEIVQFLQSSTGVRFIIEPPFAIQLERSNVRVTLSAADLVLADALRAFCKEIGAKSEIREEQDLVWISAAKR